MGRSRSETTFFSVKQLLMSFLSLGTISKRESEERKYNKSPGDDGVDNRRGSNGGKRRRKTPMRQVEGVRSRPPRC